VLPGGADPAIRLAPYRPSPPRRQRPFPSLRRPAIAALAVVVLASVAVVVILTRGPSGTSAIDVNSAAAFDLRTGAMRGQTSLGARPGRIASGAGALWVTHTEEGTVSRINPSAKR